MSQVAYRCNDADCRPPREAWRLGLPARRQRGAAAAHRPAAAELDHTPRDGRQLPLAHTRDGRCRGTAHPIYETRGEEEVAATAVGSTPRREGQRGADAR